MPRMNIVAGMFGLVIAVALAGCGGGSGSADGSAMGTAGTGGPAGQGTLTWKEAGTMHTALIASATRTKSAALDVLMITGGEASNTGVGFNVAVQPPPLAAGTFTFNPAGGYPIVSASYQANGVSATAPTAVSIDLTVLGDTTGTHAVGTFSATFSFPGGTTKTVTDGKFDLALTVSSF